MDSQCHSRSALWKDVLCFEVVWGHVSHCAFFQILKNKSWRTNSNRNDSTHCLTVRSPATGQGCRCPPCQQFRSPTVLWIGCLIFVGSVTCHVAQLDEGGRGQAWPELHPGGRRGSLYVVCLCWRALQGTPRLSQTERAFLCYLSGWRCSHFWGACFTQFPSETDLSFKGESPNKDTFSVLIMKSVDKLQRNSKRLIST